jgi:hypothetical protein
MFLRLCERPSFTPVQNNRQHYSCPQSTTVYLIQLQLPSISTCRLQRPSTKEEPCSSQRAPINMLLSLCT